MLNVNAERNICYECGVLFIGDDVVCPKCKAEVLELVNNPQPKNKGKFGNSIENALNSFISFFTMILSFLYI